MGSRITMQELGTVFINDNDAISYAEPRVKFVKGWDTGEEEAEDPEDGSSACGSGTAFPIEVTFAQLFELYYRVRDSRMTAGRFVQKNLDAEFPAEPVDYISVVMTDEAPPDDLMEFVDIENVHGSEGLIGHERGYCCTSFSTPAFTPPSANFFDLEYNITNNLLPPYDQSGASDTLYAADAAMEEGMWQIEGDTKDGKYSGMISPTEGVAALWPDTVLGTPASCLSKFRTGFSLYAITDLDPDTYAGDGMENEDYPHYTALGLQDGVGAGFLGARVVVAFSGEVAFVDNAGDGNPYNPANKLFIGVSFLAEPTLDTEYGFGQLVSDNEGVDRTASGVTFTLKMGTTELSCDLYFIETLGWPYLGACENFVLEATEWWTYARRDGTAAFAAGTGAASQDPAG